MERFRDLPKERYWAAASDENIGEIYLEFLNIKIHEEETGGELQKVWQSFIQML